MRWSILVGLWASCMAGDVGATGLDPRPAQPALSPVEERSAISAKFQRPPPLISRAISHAGGAPRVVVGRLPQVPPGSPEPPQPAAESSPVREVQVTTIVEDRPIYYPYLRHYHRPDKGDPPHHGDKPDHGDRPDYGDGPHHGEKPHKKPKPKYSRASRTWGWARGQSRRTVNRWNRMSRN